MSTQTREQLVAALTFADDSARADLLDSNVTNTELVELLCQLVVLVPGPLYITAVKSDHGNDGGTPHSHSAGDAADLWVAPTLPDASVQALLTALRDIAVAGGPVYEVGLGGAAKSWNPGGWPAGFDLFDDNSQDHVHISASTPAEVAAEPPEKPVPALAPGPGSSVRPQSPPQRRGPLSSNL